MYWGRHLVKMLKAVDVLAKAGGSTIDELAKAVDVDKRTAYRIRETLEELNFPLYADTTNLDGKTRYRFMDSYLKKLPNLTVPELNLSLSEVIALYFIRGNSRLFRGTDIEHNIEAAFTKLDAFVPEGLAKKLDKIKTLFTATAKYAKDYSTKQEIIDTLTDAIFKQQTYLVEYHSFHDDTVRNFKIDPLSFFERDGGLYIFVRATKFDQIRVLAVERIVKLTAEDVTFGIPEDFDPHTYLDGAFSIIYDDPILFKIRFSVDVARYIRERSWGREQIIIENADGSILLELNTSGWIDVKRWIMSYGADAEVLEPELMRFEVKEELKRAVDKYKGGQVCCKKKLSTHDEVLRFNQDWRNRQYNHLPRQSRRRRQLIRSSGCHAWPGSCLPQVQPADQAARRRERRSP